MADICGSFIQLCVRLNAAIIGDSFENSDFVSFAFYLYFFRYRDLVKLREKKCMINIVYTLFFVEMFDQN